MNRRYWRIPDLAKDVGRKSYWPKIAVSWIGFGGAFLYFMRNVPVPKWVYFCLFAPPVLILILWAVGMLMVNLKEEVDRRQVERDRWAEAPAAFEKAKTYHLEGNSGWMWLKMKQALFEPVEIAWTLEMIRHNQAVIEFVLKHVSDQLDSSEQEAFRELDAELKKEQENRDDLRVDKVSISRVRKFIEGHLGK